MKPIDTIIKANKLELMESIDNAVVRFNNLRLGREGQDYFREKLISTVLEVALRTQHEFGYEDEVRH